MVFRKDRPITFATLGGSETLGTGAPNPSEGGWAAQISRRLPPGSRLVNNANVGARLKDALDKQLAPTLAARPDLVAIWLVANDLYANTDIFAYERDLDRLIGEIVKGGATRILLINCPDLSRPYGQVGIPADVMREETRQWNQTIAKAAAKHPGRVVTVDSYARGAEVEVAPDIVRRGDFYLTAAGHGRTAEIVWETAIAHRLFAP